MKLKYYHFLIVFIISLIWCGENHFSIGSKTDTKIIVDFDLENFTIQNIDAQDRLIINGEPVSFSEERKKILSINSNSSRSEL